MAVSFSANAKAEMCKGIPSKNCCALAESFGILLFCNSFGLDGIRIITESKEFSEMLPRLFRKAFSLDFDIIPEPDSTGKLIFQITKEEKLETIMTAYGFDRKDTLSLHVNLPVVEEDCCKAAFLRGAFLSGGSVTDPEKGYHMELATTHGSVSRETYALMQEAVGFAPKSARRGGDHVLYLKQCDLISDFDEANTSKVVEAAQEQLAVIRVLKERGKLATLPHKLQHAAKAREENPSASLTELAAMMEPPITKPAMNHRLKKLVEAAKEV